MEELNDAACEKNVKTNINTSNEQVFQQGTKPKRQVFSKRKRLEQHQKSKDRLVSLTEKKLKIKEEYYKKSWKF